ncbi:MAG: FecR domain-containing protein [Nitrospinae bacterium]|nr:FecR domain-containing protein [Nitrospinota bacterium]
MLKRLLTSTVLAMFFVTAFCYAASAEPIKATAKFVQGDVFVVRLADGKQESVVKGTAFAEGDRVTTSKSGVVEIEMDTGNLIRVDKSSDLTIKSLRRNERGSTFSIFGLSFGRVKSAVSKLASKESKFEYHTKAAIAGVGGTPPFVVEADGDTTNVDLLGSEGQAGQVYVIGGDPSRTTVLLNAQFRTTVTTGQQPALPFPIDPERLQFLNRVIPFSVTGQPSAGGGMPLFQDVLIDNLSRHVTPPVTTNPGGAKTLEDLDTQLYQCPTCAGGGSSGGGAAGAGLTPVIIKINVK